MNNTAKIAPAFPAVSDSWHRLLRPIHDVVIKRPGTWAVSGMCPVRTLAAPPTPP